MAERLLGKRERAAADVAPLLDDAARLDELEAYLLDGSNLPGPRANLELVAALGDAVAERGVSAPLWRLFRRWLELPPDAPDARTEYLPVCASQALGAAYPRLDAEGRREALTWLRRLASDPRWRCREGVAMGLQRLGEADLAAFEAILLDWRADPSPLVQRGILAALAHPPILADPGAARFALEVTGAVLADYSALPTLDRRSNDVQVLRRALEYAPSVVVAAIPEAGFAWLRDVARAADPDVQRVVRTNLSKARLATRFASQTAEVLACLGG